MKTIERLSSHPIINREGDCYSIHFPTTSEMMDKINEIVEVVNDLQQDIAYLRDQEEKRKKYKVIRRYDVLLLAKQKLKNKEHAGLCNALSYSLSTYELDFLEPDHPNLSSYFPLYTIDQALRFGANKDHNYWWKPGRFGILSGRRRYLNWLIRKYKNDTEILNKIEIYG